MKKITILLTLLFVLSIFTACTPQKDPYLVSGTYIDHKVDLSNPDELRPFTSDDDYVTFMSSLSSNQYGGDSMLRESFNSNSMGLMLDSTMPASISMTKSAGSVSFDEGVSSDFSGTNNQVASVDEADLLKTDGDYIYTITDNVVFIIEAYPGEDSKVISQIKLKDLYPSNLLIKDNKLVIIGSADSYKFMKNFSNLDVVGLSFAYIYDISDKEHPKQLEDFIFEGNYNTARLDGDAYIITRSRPQQRDTYPLPIIMREGQISTLKARDIFYIPHSYNRPELAIVHKINLDSFNLESVAVTVNDLQTVYVSGENIYLVGQERLYEETIRMEIVKDLIKPLLSDSDLVLISKIKKTDNAVLSQWEKEQKIDVVYFNKLRFLDEDVSSELEKKSEDLLEKKINELKYLDFTIIHKIDMNDLKVKANTKIPGAVVNQFSLDEFDTHLRIATTIPRRWRSRTDSQNKDSNDIYILDNKLNTVGSLTGLAENERIYSTRFVGNRLYMVTFRQVDPFFVIDLSNPKKPMNLGELKIPGFSRYLHPYDDNHIIGIGKDTTDSGRTKGLKISLFDVADVEHPLEVAKYVTDQKYANSKAFYEHKAFLFSKKKNLLVIPVSSNEWHDGSYVGYSGAFVFNITSDSIVLRGLIDHAKDSTNYWSNQVERSLYINDLLYTKSTHLLRINALNDLHGVKDVPLVVKEDNGEIIKY